MKHLYSNRGSTVVEALLTASIIIFIFTSGFTIAYCAYAHVLLERASYEVLVCLSTPSNIHICENRLLKNISQSLRIGKIRNLHLSRTTNLARVEFQFQVQSRTVNKQLRTLRLPLHSGIM